MAVTPQIKQADQVELDPSEDSRLVIAPSSTSCLQRTLVTRSRFRAHNDARERDHSRARLWAGIGDLALCRTRRVPLRAADLTTLQQATPPGRAAAQAG